MSHLEPQLRPDKTGKMVTRHVKTNPAAGIIQAVSIPSPSASMTPAAAIAKRTTKAINVLFDGIPPEVVLKNANYLSMHQPDFLEAITEQSAVDADVKNVWKFHLNGMIASHSFVHMNGAEDFKTSLIVFPLASRLICCTNDYGGDDYDLITQTLQTKRHVSSLLAVSGREPTVPVVKAFTIAAIVRKSHLIDDSEITPFPLEQASPQVEYMSTNMDLVEPLAEELVRRGSDDIELIESLLSATPSLREGHL